MCVLVVQLARHCWGEASTTPGMTGAVLHSVLSHDEVLQYVMYIALPGVHVIHTNMMRAHSVHVLSGCMP